MDIFKNLDEKVIVARGHLLMWRGLVAVFAGNTIIFATFRFETWIGSLAVGLGAFFSVIGLIMLVASFRYASMKPEAQS